MPYVRTVKTKSGATVVQVVWSYRRGSRSIEHIGSAHDDHELQALKAAAVQRIAAAQLELDLGLETAGPSGPLPITSSRMGHLLNALDRGYRVLGLEDGLEDAAGGDEVFLQLVSARIIEPASKPGSLRVGESRGGAAVVRDGQAAAAGLRRGCLAAAAVGGLRRACPARPGQPGSLRRVYALMPTSNPASGKRRP